MTRLYIDNQEVAELPPDFKSLEQVVNFVETDHLSCDKIIRYIQIDGVSFIADDGHASHLSPRINGRERIEIFTSTLQEAALDAIREATVYLERIGQRTLSLAASFRLHSGRNEFENLQQFYEGFYWVNLLLDRLEQSFGIPLDALAVGSTTARDHHLKLAALLKKIIAAHEQDDFALVADLLEYEITPLVPACKEVFAAVRTRILKEC